MLAPRHIAILLVLLPAILMAQSVEGLLTRLGNTPDGPEQLALLARIARTYAQQKNWEEAADLAAMGASEARDQDLPAFGAEFELVLAELAQVNGDQEEALAHALRAVTYAVEADGGVQARCRIFLANTYMGAGVPTKALDYAQQALATGALSEVDKRAVMMLRTRALLAMNDDAGADSSITEATDLARKAGDDDQLRECLGQRVAQCYQRKDLAGAIAAETERLELVNGKERGIVLNNLGELYAQTGAFNKAHELYGEAATWLGTDPDLYGRTLMNSAITYGRQKQFSSAEATIENAIGIIGGRGSGEDLSQAFQVKAGILLLAGRFSEAMNTGRQALDEAQRTSNAEDELSALDLLSRIAQERGALVEKQQYDMRFANLSYELTTQEGLRSRIRSEREYALHRQERDISVMAASEQRERLRAREAVLAAENQANQFSLLVTDQELKDSQLREGELAREKAQQELRLLQNAMADERQRSELQQLQGERTVQMLQLNKLDLERKQKETGMAMLKRQNELLEKESALKAAGQKRDRLINRFALGAVALLTCTAAFFFWVFRKVKVKNRVIRTQVKKIEVINAQLSDKNADLLSSITYAQSIQQAIIPKEQQLQDLLPDSFLYYKPRDIVSGDLPFVRKVGDRVFIATIDCTGHGVPAAMLSFMAYYNINDIISTHKDLKVNDILFMLHHRIQAAVHGQSGNHAMADGMDITLVELDLERKVLWYSGAQNSLLVVRDGECQRIKGDKCSIGDPSGACSTGFNSHRIDLHAKDRVYLYSDGFIHQFGGTNGRKKFSNVQLMKTVSDLAGQSAQHAGVQLSAMHQDWQGDQPQTDDIVLIGFSINQPAAVMAA